MKCICGMEMVLTSETEIEVTILRTNLIRTERVFCCPNPDCTAKPHKAVGYEKVGA